MGISRANVTINNGSGSRVNMLVLCNDYCADSCDEKQRLKISKLEEAEPLPSHGRPVIKGHQKIELDHLCFQFTVSRYTLLKSWTNQRPTCLDAQTPLGR
jgi:hypothetical protein